MLWVAATAFRANPRRCSASLSGDIAGIRLFGAVTWPGGGLGAIQGARLRPAAGLAAELEAMCVMDEAVKDRIRDGRVTE